MLTGKPGVGKTTLIKDLLQQTDVAAGGFYTEEIRENGVRQGFRIVRLDGATATLAHTNIKGSQRVGKYVVDIEALDRTGVAALGDAVRHKRLVVVDEIGKMEMFSPAFREIVSRTLAGNKPVLGTIMLAPHPWADEVKRKPNVTVVQLTKENRQEVRALLKDWLDSLTKEEEHEQDPGIDQT